MIPTNDLMLNKPMDLGHGLVLRRSRNGDAERLAEFNGRIHGDDPVDGSRVEQWTRDMLSGKHPTMKVDEFTIVEEKKTGRIVSSMNLIPQAWSYDGIPFKVGRPEAVGTDLDFRNRGLVRKQFEVVHEWIRQRGDMLQGITGIPYYYRLFGYEMTVELDAANIGYEVQVPRLPDGEQEEYLFRDAIDNDIPFLKQLYDKSQKNMRLSCIRNEETWKYELHGRTHENCTRRTIKIILDKQGQSLGAIMHPFYLDHGLSTLNFYELVDRASYFNITPAVIRYLWSAGIKFAEESGKTCTGFNFALVGDHTAVKVAADRLPKKKRSYTWYIRVPELLSFLNLIRPALERNLANSDCCGYTGELRICQYVQGIEMKFERGKLVKIEMTSHPDEKKMDVSFPGLTFLQILFGWRDIHELCYAFPDCTLKEEKLCLVESVFPKAPSRIWQLD
jgi:hypothetical protein